MCLHASRIKVIAGYRYLRHLLISGAWLRQHTHFRKVLNKTKTYPLLYDVCLQVFEVIPHAFCCCSHEYCLQFSKPRLLTYPIQASSGPSVRARDSHIRGYTSTLHACLHALESDISVVFACKRQRELSMGHCIFETPLCAHGTVCVCGEA